jgi:hypothetical protein
VDPHTTRAPVCRFLALVENIWLILLTGLIAKRAEIAGQVEHTQDQLRAIHIFDPSIELEEIEARPVPPKHQAFRGEVSPIVLATLRNAKKPLTTQDIAHRVMAERGLDTANQKLLKLMGKRAGACRCLHPSRVAPVT